MSAQTPDWLIEGTGTPPLVSWSFSSDAPLAGAVLARETGETLAADTSGGLYRLDRQGQISGLTRGFKSLSAVAWSDLAGDGAAVLEGSTLCWFDRKLSVRWKADFSQEILAIDVDPHGHYAAVSLASGETFILTARKRKVGQYKTARPLRFLKFRATEPVVVGAAEYGLLCAHRLDGTELWDARLWSNVGDLCLSGDDQTITLARFNLGIQQLDAQGENRGSFFVGGTPNRVSTSFVTGRLAVTTVERDLYWIESTGELLWAVTLPADVRALCTDALGTGFVCGFSSGALYRLQWPAHRPHARDVG